MFEKILPIVLESMAGAFIDVGAFVGVVLLLFGYINYRQAGALLGGIEKSKGWQPVLGALLGLIPGCGGSILIMPLFIKGTVTYGAVIATLIATTGDSAFVMIATMPRQFLIISAIIFALAVVVGTLVDKTPLGARLLASYQASKQQKKEIARLHKLEGKHTFAPHLGHAEGDEVDIALHHRSAGHQASGTLAYRLTHQGYIFYLGLLAVGLVLAVLGAAQFDVDSFLPPNFVLTIGVVGALLSMILFVASKKFLAKETHEEVEIKVASLKETIIHAAQETAFVVSWVFVGFLVYELTVLLLGRGDYASGEALIETFLMATGLVAVLVGGLIGLIPGCGPQIIFVTLYSRGLLPFAALLTNSISQDGDAMFPLLALHKRSALMASVITTLLALAVGFLVYWLELHTNLGAFFNAALGN
ncbi:MAG: hypothetical protein DDT34_00870 [Firmicutes bacterium]|nr:hypothetical protein [Bacillota bacterium]